MSSPSFKKFTSALAFVATIAISLALILQIVFKNSENLSSFAGMVGLIGQIIAYSITCISAFFFVKTKRHVGWMVAYVIAVTVLVVLLVLVNI